MALAEAKELTAYASRYNVTARFNRLDVLEWAVIVSNLEFNIEKKGLKYIDDLTDANYLKGGI